MEYKGEVFISPVYKKKDYLNLKLINDRDSAQWEKAIEIFSDRINGRFLLFYIQKQEIYLYLTWYNIILCIIDLNLYSYKLNIMENHVIIYIYNSAIFDS